MKKMSNELGMKHEFTHLTTIHDHDFTQTQDSPTNFEGPNYKTVELNLERHPSTN